MQISQKGLNAIIQREGVILHAYRDSVGVWTIGTGHTTAAGPPTVRPGQVITRQENDQILLNDLKPVEEQAAKYIKVPVTQNQYDAIISIVFNVGPKFWQSTCIKRLNTGNVKGAAEAIMQWSKPPEIIGRRRTEQKQFLTPDPTPVAHSTAASVVVAGSAAAAAYPNHWHWILGGTVAAGVLSWLALRLFERKT